MPTQPQIDQYQDQGYFITEDAVDPEMMQELVASARRVKQKVRSGKVDVFTHRATDEHNSEPWAIRGLLAPEFEEPIFSEYLLSEPVMRYVHHFLGTELRLGSITIFTNPHEKDFGFGWHRDIDKTKRDVTRDQELEILNRPVKTFKWHLALVDDACLQVVPESQRRYRTDYERECLINTRHGDIPGQEAIDLKAGQTAFWNANIIHRGVMRKDIERLTLAASWAKHVEDEEPGETDHRFKWRLSEEVRDSLPDAMWPYYDRWRALQLG